MSGEDNSTTERPRYKRSVRNYLLDPHFQLKYTAFLVLIGVALSGVLGFILWRAGRELSDQSVRTVEQGKETVDQGRKTVERGKEVIVQSDKVDTVVQMTMETCYADNPEALEAFKKDASTNQSRIKEEQAKLEKDAEYLAKRAVELEEESKEVARRRNRLVTALVTMLAVLVVGIGIAGIIFTHKIAGPIFKMKRLLRQVGEGKFVLREKLRKGDELQHFFETFETMVSELRRHQEEEVAQLDAIRDQVESGDTAGALSKLKQLRTDMQARVEP